MCSLMEQSPPYRRPAALGIRTLGFSWFLGSWSLYLSLSPLTSPCLSLCLVAINAHMRDVRQESECEDTGWTLLVDCRVPIDYRISNALLTRFSFARCSLLVARDRHPASCMVRGIMSSLVKCLLHGLVSRRRRASRGVYISAYKR